MNRHQHPTDLHVRRLPLATDDDARRLSDDDAKQALFEDIVSQPIPADPGGSSDGGKVRLSRRAFVLVAALTAVSLATVGWAVSEFLTYTSSAVACHTPDGAVSVVDVVTGDPVADCAAHWTRQTGEHPPELVAYENVNGGIEVVPADTEPSEGWTALQPGVTLDPGVIELEAALDDHISGLPSQCHLAGDARQLVQREFDRLGLNGWSIVTERGQADGQDTCTRSIVHADQQTVALIPMDGLVAPDDTPTARFADALRRTFRDECLALDAAAQRIRELGAQQGIDGPGLIVHKVSDEAAECSRADLLVGGGFEVTVRGPAFTSPPDRATP